MALLNIVFRQLFDAPSCTYTYLLADKVGGHALLIDPVFEQANRDAAIIRELDLKLVATLDTHTHADHVSGSWLMNKFTGSLRLVNGVDNVEGADRFLADGDRLNFGERYVVVRSTPGHTKGCLTFVLDDESAAFTGDALLIRGCGRSDFQSGDSLQLYHSVHERILTLPGSCLLYPGHDYRGLTVTTVSEEHRWNPRLGDQASAADFVAHMAHLQLPHPKQIAVAVPANLRCGRPENFTDPAIVPPWAASLNVELEMSLSLAGVWNLDPSAVIQLASGAVQVVDVREAHELAVTGFVVGAVHIPLGQLVARVGELDASRPVLCVCRSGSRSTQACVLLRTCGVGAANVRGGMLRWLAEELPVQRGPVEAAAVPEAASEAK